MADFVTGTIHTYDQNTWAFNSIVTGADGKFYLAFKEDSEQVNIRQWDGTEWVNHSSFTAADTGNTSISDDLDLAIDATGQLHIAFRPSLGDGLTSDRGVAYGTYDGADWSFDKIDSASHEYGWKNYDDPSLAIDGNGHAHMVYQYTDSTDDSSEGGYHIRYATNESGSWETQDLVYHPGRTGINELHAPWVGVGNDGTVQVTYVSEDNQNDVFGNLYHTTRAADGSWSTPEKLVDAVAEGESYYYETPALDDDGNIHVLFSHDTYENDEFASGNVHDVTNASGAWSREDLFSSTEGSLWGAQFQQVGGTQYMLLQRSSPGFGGELQEARIYFRQDGGEWQPGNEITEPLYGSEIVMNVNEANEVMIVTLDNELRNISYIAGPASDAPPVCFFAGTRIRTPQGEVAIENLQPGDAVYGASGVRQVKWLGWRKYNALMLGDAKNREAHLPIRIRAGALAHNLPDRDLLVSPWHHLYIDGVLVRAGRLVNGISILQDTQVRRIEYYHVELDQFDVVQAHGVYSESWADGGNRSYFQNADVTTLRPQDYVRRLASRPGFKVIRDAKTERLLQQRFAARAVAQEQAARRSA